MSEQNTPDQEAKIIPFPVSRAVGEQAIAGMLDTPQVTPTDEVIAELPKEPVAPLVLDFRGPVISRNNPNHINRHAIAQRRKRNS